MGGGGAPNPPGTLLFSSLVSSVTCLRSWQSDFGVTMGGTLLAAGTAPPVVTVTGTTAATTALRIEITLLGVAGVAQFRYFSDGGTTPIASGVVTAATVALTGALAGITVAFPVGPYATDNVYTGTVSNWADQQNLTNAAQATGSKQPLIIPGLNGHAGFAFDGVDDLLGEATLDLPPPGTTPTFIWGVFTQKAWKAAGGAFAAGPTLATIQIGGTGVTPQNKIYNGTAGPANAGAVLGSPVRFEALWNNATTDYLKLGATTATGTNTGNSNPAANFFIGGVTNLAANSGTFDFYALLIFNAKPSAGELAALSSAVTTFYGGLVGV